MNFRLTAAVDSLRNDMVTLTTDMRRIKLSILMTTIRLTAVLKIFSSHPVTNRSGHVAQRLQLLALLTVDGKVIFRQPALQPLFHLRPFAVDD